MQWVSDDDDDAVVDDVDDDYGADDHDDYVDNDDDDDNIDSDEAKCIDLFTSIKSLPSWRP